MDYCPDYFTGIKRHAQRILEFFQVLCRVYDDAGTFIK